MMRLDFYEDDQGEHRWKLTAENGERVANSGEGFADLRNAELNYELFMNNASLAWGAYHQRKRQEAAHGSK